MPRFSRRELAFLRFRATVLHSCSTSFTSVMYEPKPRLSRAAVWRQSHAGLSFQHTSSANIDQVARTVDHVLWRDGLFVGLVADFIGLRGDEVDELRAAVDHQLPGVVGHSDVGKRLFDHLVDGCSGDRQVVVVSRRSHRGEHMTTSNSAD